MGSGVQRFKGSGGGTVSLPRAISKLGYTSRRIAEGLVEAGRVKVNGRVIKDKSYRLIPEVATIEVDGHPLRTIRLLLPLGLGLGPRTNPRVPS